MHIPKVTDWRKSRRRPKFEIRDQSSDNCCSPVCRPADTAQVSEAGDRMSSAYPTEQAVKELRALHCWVEEELVYHCRVDSGA